MTSNDMTPDEWEAGHEFHIEHQACPGYSFALSVCADCFPEDAYAEVHGDDMSDSERELLNAFIQFKAEGARP